MARCIALPTRSEFQISKFEEPVELARLPVGAESAVSPASNSSSLTITEGLKAAIRQVLPETARQRCYVHFSEMPSSTRVRAAQGR